MRFIRYTSLIFGLALLSVPLLPAAAISVSAGNPTANGTFSVTVKLSDTGQPVSGVSFDLLFDPTLIAFDGDATFGDPSLTPSNQLALTTVGTGGASLASANDASVYYVSFDSPGNLQALQASSFQFVSLGFTGTGVSGTSALTLTNLLILDQNADDVTGNFTVNDGSITIEPVAAPEPASLLLLLAGVPALLFLCLSKRPARSAHRHILASLALASVFGAPAFASNINYTLTDNQDQLTFSISQNPTVTGSCNLSIDCFSVAGIQVNDVSQSWSNATIDFYSNANGGGLAIQDAANNVVISNLGPLVSSLATQLFSGPFTAPTLLPFTNLQLLSDGSVASELGGAFLLNAVSGPASVAPEPAAWSLLAVSGAVLVCYRRRPA